MYDPKGCDLDTEQSAFSFNMKGLTLIHYGKLPQANKMAPVNSLLILTLETDLMPKGFCY